MTENRIIINSFITDSDIIKKVRNMILNRVFPGSGEPKRS